MALFLQIQVEPHGDESWHVECIAQGFAAAADEGLSLPLAGLAAVGDKSGKAPGLFSVKRAKLSSFAIWPAISASSSASWRSTRVRRALICRGDVPMNVEIGSGQRRCGHS